MCPARAETSSARPSRTRTSRPRYARRPLLTPYRWLTRPWFVQFIEVQAQHAFVRDEQSKGRWDAALTRSIFGFMMEVFERTVGRDLGERVDDGSKIEHVC